MNGKVTSSLLNISYRLARTDSEKYAALELRQQMHGPITDSQRRLLEECRDNCCFLVIAIRGKQIIGLTRMHEHPVYLPKGIMLDCVTVDRLFDQPLIISNLIECATREAALRGYAKCYASISRTQELLVLQTLGFLLETPCTELANSWLVMKSLAKPSATDAVAPRSGL